MVDLLQAPIPGQSLTDLPKNSPWEKPSDLTEVKDVVSHYVERLADDEVLDDLVVVFELGGDLKMVTETMVTAGAMKGLHTVEAGMLAGPVIASFIKAVMTTYGIDAKETAVDPTEAAKDRQFKRLMMLVNAAREKGKSAEAGDPGIFLLEEMSGVAEGEDMGTAEEVEPMEETPIAPAGSGGSGLMARGAE